MKPINLILFLFLISSLFLSVPVQTKEQPVIQKKYVMKEGKQKRLPGGSSVAWTVDDTSVVSVEDDYLYAKKEGVTTIYGKSKKKEYEITVKVKFLLKQKNSLIGKIYQLNREEYRDSDYRYLSPSTYLSIQENETEDRIYQLAHIAVRSPEQIRHSYSSGSFGGISETPSHAAKRLSSLLLVNGSYFGPVIDYKSITSVFPCGACHIENGTVIQKGFTTGKEICLTQTGRMFTPAPGLTAETLIQKFHVKSLWWTALPVLINQNETCEIPSSRGSKFETYPRTVIGMVSPNEYYVMTVGSYYYRQGMTLKNITKILKQKGCSYVRCLDGGGSSAMIFKKKQINTSATGKERPVADFLYFTDDN